MPLIISKRVLQSSPEVSSVFVKEQQKNNDRIKYMFCGWVTLSRKELWSNITAL
jgi:hypothetical protein